MQGSLWVVGGALVHEGKRGLLVAISARVVGVVGGLLSISEVSVTVVVDQGVLLGHFFYMPYL